MKKTIILVLALALAGAGASAQQTELEVQGNAGMYPERIIFSQGQEPGYINGKVLLKAQDGYVYSSDAVLNNTEKDQIGQEHFRYQQVINGIPVEGAIYAVHVAGDKIKSFNGQWIAKVPSGLQSTASVSAATALQNAMKAFGAKMYKWQIPEEETFIKNETGDAAATFMPKEELVYYSGEGAINVEHMRLAYKLDLYANEPVGRRVYFIDAQTGAVLGKREIMHTADATGTAVTGYSGTKTIITDSYNGSYRLREATRGNGIQTFNLKKGTNYNTAVDFTDADNNWNNVNATKDQYATDAHWGAEQTYDYYKNTFGRNSINNAGFAIKSYVHYSNNYFNAFWDGSRMTYGDGNSTDNYLPLTALDVCGHEITHGLTSFTANLNYSYESGALNEGFSDVFGTVIEYYGNPSTANWLIGEAFYTIRSMSNPNTYGQPDTYQGTNWATGSADNGGVHTNSGILNFWFYLLTQGGSGTNDKSFSYSVSGIGMNKAAAIAYRTLTVYLISSSNYANARTYSIQAAKDMYGAASNEATQVANAWDAVGVTGAVTPPPCSDVYESNESRTAAKAIAANTDIIARIGSFTDKDWFTFTTTSAAPKLKVTLNNLPADYDLRLYNASGIQLGISQNGSTAAESISYNSSSTAATYYVQVYGYAGAYSTSVCYTLRAATSNVNQLADEQDDDNEGLVKTVGSAEINNDEVVLYPNPAKDKMTLGFVADEEGIKTITITDVVGHTIQRQTISASQGANHINLSLEQYKPGIYFLNVSGMRTVKFIVTE